MIQLMKIGIWKASGCNILSKSNDRPILHYQNIDQVGFAWAYREESPKEWTAILSGTLEVSGEERLGTHGQMD